MGNRYLKKNQKKTQKKSKPPTSSAWQEERRTSREQRETIICQRGARAHPAKIMIGGLGKHRNRGRSRKQSVLIKVVKSKSHYFSKLGEKSAAPSAHGQVKKGGLTNGTIK